MTDHRLITIFPTTEANWHNENVRTEGMTLRDHFAAKAMRGAIANNMFSDAGSDHEIEWVVRLSYKYADAMLKAREQSND